MLSCEPGRSRPPPDASKLLPGAASGDQGGERSPPVGLFGMYSSSGIDEPSIPMESEGLMSFHIGRDMPLDEGGGGRSTSLEGNGALLLSLREASFLGCEQRASRDPF